VDPVQKFGWMVKVNLLPVTFTLQNQGTAVGSASYTMVVVSVSRHRLPTSRIGLVSRKIVNVSVSGGRRLGLVSVSAITSRACPIPTQDHH